MNRKRKDTKGHTSDTCILNNIRLASSSAPTTRNNIASLKKSVKCPPRNTTKLPPKDQIADSKPRKTPDFPVEGSMRLDDKVVTPPRETSECPHGDDPSRGLLVIDEKSPHAQSREDTNVELQRIETDTVTGFTPVNARTSSYAYDGMSHQRRASRGIESVTRHEESAIVDTVPQSHSDKENHTTGLNLLEAVEGCSTHQDAANSANATNRISQKVMREAALKCTRPATACSTKRRPISSKGQQRRRRASNPKQPISVAMLKPTEPPSPFVFQRRAGYHVDENPDQALPSTTYLPDECPSEPPQVSFGEDWAVVEHYTNCILPGTQPNTTPSKKVSNRIRKILRTSGASMQSTMDTSGNEAAKDNGKATTVETTSLANPNHTGSNSLNEASFPTDISTQAAMHLAHCGLQDTLISPTKPVMTPAPANRATAQADSQRRITLSGPPINTQDILADVSSFAFDTAQKLVDNDELFGNVVQLQSPMSPTRTPQKERINGPASQQDNNPGTREDGDAMGLLGESFNLSETIEDMSVYLKDSNAGVEEMRAVTMDREIALVMEK